MSKDVIVGRLVVGATPGDQELTALAIVRDGKSILQLKVSGAGCDDEVLETDDPAVVAGVHNVVQAALKALTTAASQIAVAHELPEDHFDYKGESNER